MLADVKNDQRLLLVHAHPDDESSQSAATMAHYLATGAQVTLVTCTLGERGEILVPEWGHYTPAELGRHRQREIGEAMALLGLTDHVFLGGVGRYHDTGMARNEQGKVVAPDDMPENAFWRADLLEAADHLVEIIRDRRPQVVSTYDPFGGYGHPDHVQAHRVTMYAVSLAAAPSHRPDLGEPWAVNRVLWSTHNMTRWQEAYQIAHERGIELWPEGERGPDDQSPDPANYVALIETAPWLEVCQKVLVTHRSQVDASHPFWRFFQIMRELPGAGETYLLACGQPFPAGSPQRLSADLFEGIELGG